MKSTFCYEIGRRIFWLVDTLECCLPQWLQLIRKFHLVDFYTKLYFWGIYKLYGFFFPKNDSEFLVPGLHLVNWTFLKICNILVINWRKKIQLSPRIWLSMGVWAILQANLKMLENILGLCFSSAKSIKSVRLENRSPCWNFLKFSPLQTVNLNLNNYNMTL